MKKTALFTVFALILVAVLAFGFAGCRKKTIEYRITCEGGDEVVTVVSDGKTAFDPPAGVKTGYLFRRWTNKDGSDFVPANWLADKKKHDIKIFGRFDPVHFTVAFDGNGNTAGVSMNNIPFVYDSEQMLPANVFERKGMRFGHWEYAGGVCEDKAIVKNLSAEDGGLVVLKAIWEPAEYTLTFDARGGTVEPETAGPFGYMGEYDVSEVIPERPGYAFDCWYANEITGVPVPFDDTGFYPYSGDVTVFAEWDEEQYGLKYVCVTNHSNPAGDKTDEDGNPYYTVESDEQALKDPEERAGYVFDGWYDEDGERVEKIFGGMIGDHTLTARWTMSAEGSGNLIYATGADGTYRIVCGRAGRTPDLAVPAVNDGLPVTEIAAGAFEGDEDIRRAEISNSVTKIGANAFRGCSELEKIIIPASVTEAGDGAFDGLDSLESVYVDSPQVAASLCGAASGLLNAEDLYVKEGVQADPGLAEAGFMAVSSPDEPGYEEGYAHYVRSGAETDVDGLSYKVFAADDEYDFDYAFVLGLYVDPDADPDAEPVTAVEIPGKISALGREFTVVMIYDSAFSPSAHSECESLETVSIPASVRTLGDEAFYATWKTALRSVTFAEDSLLEDIGVSVFKGCAKLEEIEIPAGVLIINTDAFNGCRKLGKLPFAETAAHEIIGVRAFWGCSGLRSAAIPASVKIISDYAFEKCGSLQSVSFGAGSALESFGTNAFRDCTSLTRLEIPAGVETLNGDLFDGIPLEEIAIDSPALIREINGTSGWVEGMMRSLPALNIPAAEAAKLDRTAGSEYGKLLLDCLELPAEEGRARYMLPYWKNGGIVYEIREEDGIRSAYAVDRQSLAKYAIPKELHAHGGIFAVRGLADGLFSGTNIVSVVFEEGCAIDKIPYRAFYNCYNLESIRIPETVTEIGDQAFMDCDRLSEIVIPAAVTKIGTDAFEYCYDLEKVFIDSPEIAKICADYDACGGLIDDDRTDVYVREGLETDENLTREPHFLILKEDAPDSEDYREGYVHYVGRRALVDGVYYCLYPVEEYEGFNVAEVLGIADPEATSVNIPATVTMSGLEFRVLEIGCEAFCDCEALETVTFGAGSYLDKIADFAFAGCSALREIAIPASVTYIDVCAFRDCEALETVTFEAGCSLELLENSMFENCVSLKEIELPASLKSLGGAAFDGCSALEAVRFEAGSALTSIGYDVFDGCTSLRHIEIPAGVGTISDANLFRYLPLDEIVIDSSAIVGALSSSSSAGYLLRDGIAPAVYIPEADDARLGSGFGNYLNNNFISIPSDREGYAERVRPELVSGAIEYEISPDPDETRDALCVVATGGNPSGDLLLPAAVSAYGRSFPLRAVGANAFKNKNIRTLAFADGCEPEIIGNGAFYGCGSMISAAIPASVRMIGEYAFQDCALLGEITFGEGSALETTGEYAFAGTGIVSVSVPASLKSLGEGTFKNCGKLENATFEEGSRLTEIPMYAFSGTALSDIDLPESVRSIGQDAFSDCGPSGVWGPSPASVRIPAGVRAIGSSAFDGCCPERVFIDSPDVAARYSDDFSGSFLLDSPGIHLYVLEGLDVDSAITSPDGEAFIKDVSSGPDGLVDGYVHYCSSFGLRVGDLLYWLEPDMVGDADKAGVLGPADPGARISSVEIPARISALGYDFTVVAIEEDAFSDCEFLRTLSFAEGCAVETIGDYAFDDTGLSSVKIPASVKRIGKNAFAGCWSLMEITFAEGSALEELGRRAFNDCSLVAAVNLPASVRMIGNEAFYSCDSLETVTFGNGSLLESVGNGAFRYCSKLREIALPASLKTIGDQAFWNCAALEAVRFEAGSALTTFGTDAFNGCSALRHMEIPAGVEAISDTNLFSVLPLEEVLIDSPLLIKAMTGPNVHGGLVSHSRSGYIPEAQAKKLGAEYGPFLLDCLRVPSDIEGYAEYVWPELEEDGTIYTIRADLDEGGLPVSCHAEVTGYGSPAPAYVSIRASLDAYRRRIEVKGIADGAFAGCSAIARVSFAEGSAAETIGAGAFNGCSKLKTVSVPASVKTIGESAFEDCAALESVSFEAGSAAKDIEANAFKGCVRMSSFAFPASVVTLGADSFRNCDGLREIVVDSEQVAAVCGSTMAGSGLLDNEGIERIYIKDGLQADSKITTDFGFIKASYNAAASDRPGYVLFGSSKVSDGVLFYRLIAAADDAHTAVLVDFVDEDIETAEIPAIVSALGYDFAVKEIANEALGYCENLKTIVFADGCAVEKIGNSAFYGTIVESVRIPASVKEIGDAAFGNCLALRKVYVDSPEIVKGLNSADACGGLVSYAEIVYVPAAEVSKLKNDAGAEYGAYLLDDDLIRLDPSDAAGYAEYALVNLYKDGIEYRIVKGADNAYRLEAADGTSAPSVVVIPAAIQRYGLSLPVRGIAAEAFASSASIKTILFAKDSALESIGANAFSGSSLRAIKIPATVKTIGDGAFVGSDLRSAIIGSPAVIKALNATDACGSLAAVADMIFIPEAEVSKLSATAGSEYGSELAGHRVRISSAQEGYAEYVRPAFTDDVLEYEIREGDTARVSGVSGMLPEEFSIPGQADIYETTFVVNGIADEAFAGQYGLEKISVPASVKEIGKNAFNGCSLLTCVRYEGTMAGWIAVSKDADWLGDAPAANVVCSDGYVEGASTKSPFTAGLEYEAVMSGSKVIGYVLAGAGEAAEAKRLVIAPVFDDDVGIGARPVIGIKAEAFKNNGALESVILPPTIESIGASAFHGCAKLASVRIPAGVQEIGGSAFQNCAELATVTFEPGCGLDVIAAHAFDGCAALTAIEIPASVQTIDEGAFLNCSKLASVTFGENSNLLYIKEGAFKNCVLLDGIVIPGYLEEIEAEAFYNCDALTAIEIPSLVEVMGADVFNGCSELATVTFEEESGLIAIESGTFKDCTKLAAIEIPASVKTIGDYAFQNCAELATVTFEAECELETIGVGAFTGCAKLVELVLPDGVKNVGKNAFKGCSMLTSLTVPAGAEKLGEEIVRGCVGLNEITFAGTMAQWNTLAAASAGWNTGSVVATVKCTDGDVDIAAG